MDSDDIIALMVIQICLERKRESRKRRIWMKDSYAKREKLSYTTKLLKEPKDPTHFKLKNFLRMDNPTYQKLLMLVAPEIQRADTVMRSAITPNERLSATLCFLASGKSYEDLKDLTCISPQSLGRFIIETCQVLIHVLKPLIKMPTHEEEWKDIASKFENQWDFVNCIGAIDGKHVQIKKPIASASLYYNYKKTFSIVMLAIVNANYEFMNVKVGAEAKAFYSGVFAQSELKRRDHEKSLHIPKPRKIPETSYKLPYVLVGDNAFPLTPNLMKEYSGDELTNEELLFNNRLSKARNVAENAFSILANRFRILLTTINVVPEKASIIVECCCYLHNYLSRNNNAVYLRDIEYSDIMAGNHQQLYALEPLNDNPTDSAKYIRNRFCKYFNTIGAVPGENNHI